MRRLSEDTPAAERTAQRLRVAAGLRDAAEEAIAAEIVYAHWAELMSWREIGECLGITAQAAQQRYGGSSAASRTRRLKE